MKYGALEAGGTKMVVAVADEGLHILARESIPTLTPAETMPRILDFFRMHQPDALGVGSFGPLDLHPASPTYGYITKTPKLAWCDYPLLPEMQKALGVPCALDTDVNAAALCEAELGAARGVKNCVYVTVGTGIGAGVYCEGNLVHGLMHPEWGHMLLAPRADDPMPQGVCPYHTACLEGLASGPAIEKRWGVSARELPQGHKAWALEAHYLAQMCVAALMILSPEKIVLGGTPRAVFSRVEDMRAEGLAVPETTELLYRFRKLGYDVPIAVFDADECADVIASAAAKKAKKAKEAR